MAQALKHNDVASFLLLNDLLGTGAQTVSGVCVGCGVDTHSSNGGERFPLISIRTYTTCLQQLLAIALVMLK